MTTRKDDVTRISQENSKPRKVIYANRQQGNRLDDQNVAAVLSGLPTNLNSHLDPLIEGTAKTFSDSEDEDVKENIPLLAVPRLKSKMNGNLNEMSPGDPDQNEHCHSQDHARERARLDNISRVKRKLLLANIFCLSFAIAEAFGGYLSGSYAIVSDAAHMLSDFANLAIGLVAVHVGGIKPKRNFNFGLVRAEAIGALFSVILIWNVAAILLFESISRIVSNDFEIQSTPMLIAGACAVAFNVFMVVFLRGVPHSHSHGGGGIARDMLANGYQHQRFVNEDEEAGGGEQVSNNESIAVSVPTTLPSANSSHEHRHHLNIRAATVHALGDVFQSTGVFVVSIIIKVKPSWKILDPVCSIVFCFVVVYTTIYVFLDTIKILMEGTPKGIKFEDVKADLLSIDRVVSVHDLRLWSLTSDKNALAVHLAVDVANENVIVAEEIVREATKIARSKYNVSLITVQVEAFQRDVMESCEKCKCL